MRLALRQQQRAVLADPAVDRVRVGPVGRVEQLQQ